MMLAALAIAVFLGALAALALPLLRRSRNALVSQFGDVGGLTGLGSPRRLEIAPYMLVRNTGAVRGDDVHRSQQGTMGADLKYGLTSNLTLDGTINPDFGQVEVDPAVVNLSQFETFYPEKRPFFTEGLNIFNFNDTPAPSHFNFFFSPSVFYTRRIGRAPQVIPAADFVDVPSETTILGAAKVTGKLPGGWAIGVLDALTAAERARFESGGVFARQQAEPLTNYFVSRATKEIGDTSRVGMMLTSVDRRLPDELSLLRKSAVTGGFDGYTSFAEKSWILEGSAVGSRVTGSTEAIAATQTSPAHDYQRPDAGHVVFDPTRTSLSGWGGRAMLSKATGLWRPNISVQAYSPGFETNDAGFLQRTDIISAHAIAQFVDQNPTAHFRERNLWLGTWQNRNFDGNTLERGVFAETFATFLNYWTGSFSLFGTTEAFSDRTTRGGPLVRTPASWSSDFGIGSDDRKSFSARLNGHADGSRDGSYTRTLGLAIAARPRSNLQVSAGPSLYIFAALEQRTFALETRVDWTLTSRLSFQLYLQPFIASGDFHDYHALAAARTRDYTPYTYSAADPDFNFRSVRGSAVARWEFRPGSALYVVWNENRANVAPFGDFRLRRDLRAIPTAPSHDVFLIKFSYWLPL